MLSGVLFCVGGRGASGTPFKTIECYDPRKDQWIHVVDMSTRRRHVGVVAVGGQLFIALLLFLLRNLLPFFCKKQGRICSALRRYW